LYPFRHTIYARHVHTTGGCLNPIHTSGIRLQLTFSCFKGKTRRVSCYCCINICLLLAAQVISKPDRLASICTHLKVMFRPPLTCLPALYPPTCCMLASSCLRKVS
jgi:hypothetical protein